MHIFLYLIIGGLAGWLAGEALKGKGFGLLGNIVIGVIGGFVGGFLFDLIGIQTGGLFGALVTAFTGAVVFTYIIGLVSK